MSVGKRTIATAPGAPSTHINLSPAEVEQRQAESDANAAELASKQYIQDRIKAYPSIQDQLDKIYHEGLDAWKAQIKAVKDAYPKPE